MSGRLIIVQPTNEEESRRIRERTRRAIAVLIAAVRRDLARERAEKEAAS